MGKPAKGQFIPKNMDKYIGNNKGNIIYRSSWEMSLMLYFDAHPMVLAWMSECLPSNTVHRGVSGIPYYNPIAKRWTIYVPDFFVIYIDKNNKQHAEVIEVKPIDETWFFNGTHGKNKHLKEQRQIINAAKFKAAIEFCASRGWKFRIATENDMFKQKKPTQTNTRPK